MSTQLRSCATRLVADEPSGTDDFGPHERIARAILDMVEHEPGGRSVGVTGSYGSGKSTVVNLLKAQLNELPTKDDRFVWVFDAWAHDGDPLRRTFLEDLTEALLQHGWVPKAQEKRWRNQLRRLRRRFRRVETETQPRPSWPGVGIALAVLLAPLAVVVLTAGLRNAHLELGVPNDPIGWAATLLLLPFIVAVGVLLRGVVVGRGFNDKALEHVGRVIVQKEGASQTSNTYETGEPTSLEFEEFFSRLMGDVLIGDRKLILVIDNLDRVEPEDATRIWSTLRTFLDPGARARSRLWLRRLWVIWSCPASVDRWTLSFQAAALAAFS
jgi:energy-coupling factor transporter ATP-binding protein EcfA2